MYQAKRNRPAADLLKRLHYFVGHDLNNIHTDDGSEFATWIDCVLTQLEATQWDTRKCTPRDSVHLKEFNETLQYE